jgi:hypothetical protein
MLKTLKSNVDAVYSQLGGCQGFSWKEEGIFQQGLSWAGV